MDSFVVCQGMLNHAPGVQPWPGRCRLESIRPLMGLFGSPFARNALLDELAVSHICHG